MFKSAVLKLLRQPWLWLLPLIPWWGGSLMAEDEGYYGLQARWMLHTGDWLTLHWWQEPRFDRSIGVQWLQAIAMAVGGETT
ncbi:MAG: hypothetical protein HC926_04870 [Synechococcaceae cyanobacterium SM2_3_60]|nr:hypothetical protein [Synechococcaceae cyanobacterium SM2_3_60]